MSNDLSNNEQKSVKVLESPPPPVTARKVWWVTAVVISVLVLALTLGGVVGTWVLRSVALDVAAQVMSGVNRLAGAGIETIDRADTRLHNLQETNTQISTAVNELANDVSNRGLVRVLLPTETDQALQTRLDQVRETVVTVRQIITAVSELYQAVNRMPLVSLPGPTPEEIENIQGEISRIEDDVATLRTELQAVRDGKAERVRTVLVVTDRIDAELTATRQFFAETTSKLDNLRQQTAVWLQQLNLILTILSVLVSVILLWVSFSLVTLIRSYWLLLRPPTTTPLVD